jgi:hypothetical protein
LLCPGPLIPGSAILTPALHFSSFTGRARPKTHFLLRAGTRPLRFFLSCCLVLSIALGCSPTRGVWIHVSCFGFWFRLPRQQHAIPAQQSGVAAQGFCFSLHFTARFIFGFVGLRRLCRWSSIYSSASGFGTRFIHSLGLSCCRPACSPLPYFSAHEQGLRQVDFGSHCLGLRFCLGALPIGESRPRP